MIRFRVNIVLRLVVGLLALLILLLFSSGLALISFSRFEREFADLGGQQLPAVVAAGRLAQQSENLVAQAPSLVISDTSFGRDSIALRIADQSNWTGALIDDLAQAGASADDVARLQALKDDLVANLSALSNAAERQLAAERTVDSDREALDALAASLRASEDALLAEAETEGARLRAELGGDGTSAATLARQADDTARIRQAARRLQEAVAAVQSGLGTSRLLHLSQARERFQQRQNETAVLLRSLPAAAEAMLAPSAGRCDEIGRHALTARGEAIAARVTVQSLLARNTVISDMLVGGIANITASITEQVRQTSQMTRDTAAQRRLFLYASVVGGALAALGILIYLKTAVLERLRALRACLRDQTSIDVLERLCTGRDEIGEMACSLRYFMATIAEREAELRQSELRYRTLYHRTPVMLHSADADGRLIHVSDYWLEAMGYARDEVIGRRAVRFLTRDSRHRMLRDLLPQLRAAGQLKNIDLRGCRKNGEAFDLLLSTIIEQRPDGSFVQTLTVLTDITDQKRVEGDLAAMAAELQRSNAELEQFAYVASHDLREPLRMIGGYVSLLGRRYGDKLDEDAHEFIRFAADGAARMDRLVLGLLEYSRVGRSQQPLEPVAVAEVLERVLHDLRLAIADGAAALSLPSELPVVMADRQQLSRVLQNLLGNAMKYRAANQPCRIALNCQRRGTEWQFCISDNGIGIGQDDQERIFQLFQRLHGRGDYEGTGLGLAIAKKIVERHGGRIWVESAGAGTGSRFLFTLPAVDSAAPCQATTAEPCLADA